MADIDFDPPTELKNGTTIESREVEKSSAKPLSPNWREDDISLHKEINYDPGAVVRITAPNGQIFEFQPESRIRSRWSNGLQQEIALWALVCDETGGIEYIPDRDLVPAELLSENKVVIAAYLSAAQRYDNDKIAEKLDVSKQTVEQYLSDFRSDRR